MEGKPTTGLAYVVTWVALLALTTTTLLLSRVDLGALQVPVALGIAGVKGALVVFVFMHLNELRSVNRVFMLAAFLFIVLLVGLIVSDVVNRPERVTPPESRPGAPAGAIHR